MNSVLAILIGLMSGAAMSVAVSSVWCVLHLPARIQHLLHAASPRMMGLALLSGLMLAALHNALRWTLGLPEAFGVVAMVVGGMFVGMVASALGEILEVRAGADEKVSIGGCVGGGTGDDSLGEDTWGDYRFDSDYALRTDKPGSQKGSRDNVPCGVKGRSSLVGFGATPQLFFGRPFQRKSQ